MTLIEEQSSPVPTKVDSAIASDGQESAISHISAMSSLEVLSNQEEQLENYDILDFMPIRQEMCKVHKKEKIKVKNKEEVQ